jgi:N-acetylmuramoyl-L-alanine amidase
MPILPLSTPLTRSFVAVVFAILTVTSTFAAKPGPSLNPRTVCIDAGHGGSDPGAVYYGLQEKDLNKDIAYRLKALLENANAGFTVVLTRPNDETLGNTERANICNEAGADAVLSIHLNASTNPSIDYFQAFYGKRNKDGDFTQTIWDNYNITKPNNSDLIQKNNPTQFASGLLLKTNAPACLAETVFLSNADEATLLGDGSRNRQQEIAQHLFKGLMAWYSR